MQAWQVVLHAVALVSIGAAAESKYLVVSLPSLRQVGYVALHEANSGDPDAEPPIRPLITSGLVSPKGLTIDPATSRLFVADPGQLPPKVFWYQLLEIGSGRLMTDGRQHVAVESAETSHVTVDGTGSLYFTGKYLVPPPLTSQEGLFRHSSIAMATGVTTDPALVWSAGNTGNPAKYSGGAGVATDNLNVFWANGAAGLSHGSVIKAPSSPPDANAAAAVSALAADQDRVNGVCITPQLLFYTTPNGVFGIDKAKLTSACDAESCVAVNTELPDPQSLVWDGDGTVYVADASLDGGKVVSFPAGALQAHEYQKVAAAPRVSGVALLQTGGQRSLSPSASGAAALGFALLQLLQ